MKAEWCERVKALLEAEEDQRESLLTERCAGDPDLRRDLEARLDAKERLELFVEICGGAHHAHQMGIIHRDNRPSNVLVTLVDGEPVPKIIDFGVAKATAPQLAEATFLTELGQTTGTPEYMSPEQTG